jgi:nucleotide-binding universal stress UspA family protein
MREIIKEWQQDGFDLILGSLKRGLLGSVSSSVVRHAHRSVLVVREEE